MKPILKLLKPITEYAERAARSIDVKRFVADDIYYGKYYAWVCVADGIFEKMDIPMSASGELEDVLDCLQPNHRKMKVEKTSNGYSIEYKSGGDKVFLSVTSDGGMILTFKPYCLNDESFTPYDISCYGPDSVAAVIAALFKANRIIEEKFQRHLYR